MSGRTDAGSAPRSGFTFTNFRQHPFPRYVISGTITFLVDIGSLRILHGMVGLALIPAILIAYFVAFAFNFTISRRWTFAKAARSGPARRQLARYLFLVGVNLLTTVLIVAGLSSVGVNYLIAKVVAGGLNALGNFVTYRRWIFAAPPVL